MKNLNSYFEYINSPWGKLFYKLIQCQLGEIRGKTILDFGSGFGITADYLASDNTVFAVEPDKEISDLRFCRNEYTQIIGGTEILKSESDKKYDIVICHNVLEYVDNRSEIMTEFCRVLKDNGFISVVKHNRMGKIMQKAVFEYNVEETAALLNGDDIVSENFGVIREYDDIELEQYSNGDFYIDDRFGIRTFYGLQNNDIKSNPDWIVNMLKLESLAQEIPDFYNIAFFHHLILRKRNKKD